MTLVQLTNEKPFYIQSNNVAKFTAKLVAQRAKFFNKIAEKEEQQYEATD